MGGGAVCPIFADTSFGEFPLCIREAGWRQERMDVVDTGKKLSGRQPRTLQER